MTVYNYEKFIGDSIESILSQTFSNFEFIIVNDASTDRTEEVINSYKDKRIIYIRNETNIGQTKSLNKGIRAARGKYLARMDSDDMAFPQRLSMQVEFMEKNPKIGVVGAWLQSVDERNRLIRKSRYPAKPTLVRLLLLNLLNWPCLTHPTVMMRKEVFDCVGGYDERYFISQDYDLWLRIARKYPLRNIPCILLSYREHRHSLSRSKKERTKQEVKDIVRSNVRFFMPDLPHQDCDSLVKLLMFEKQKDPASGEKAFEILDTFFESVKKQSVDDCIIEKEFAYLKDIARMFYLPQLIVTNPRMAVKTFMGLLRPRGKWFFSLRFTKAIGHAILR
jgi:GT2 family glycosyltransferase